MASSDSAPTIEATKPLSCIGGASNGAKHNEFTVECGFDHFGGDIGAVDHATTFEECMDSCEANEQCIVVSWVWGSCYMKNVKNDGLTVEHVWGAVRTARVTAASIEASITPLAVVDATPSLGVAKAATPTVTIDTTNTPSTDASDAPSEAAAVTNLVSEPSPGLLDSLSVLTPINDTLVRAPAPGVIPTPTSILAVELDRSIVAIR